MNRILIGCFYLIIAGCTSKLPEKTIILSKEYSSKTCENFITRLDSNYSWHFIDAYTVSSDELNEELKKADGIILTGGADIQPLWGRHRLRVTAADRERMRTIVVDSTSQISVGGDRPIELRC